MKQWLIQLDDLEFQIVRNALLDSARDEAYIMKLYWRLDKLVEDYNDELEKDLNANRG